MALAVFATTAVVGASALQTQQSANAASFIDPISDNRKAPTVVTGENVYIAWWSNKTGNDEVLFRASTDSGATFGERINLSNTTTAESVDAEIAAEGDSVAVTWWERNSTSNEPVARISTNAGETFGPLLQLSQNGTIGNGGE
jgi:hypothetical protein